MPFTYRRRIKILPGLYLNLNRGSVSVTGVAGPLRQTVSTSGRRTTSVNVPGRGLGWRTTSTPESRRRKREELEARKAAALARREERREARRARREGR